MLFDVILCQVLCSAVRSISKRKVRSHELFACLSYAAWSFAEGEQGIGIAQVFFQIKIVQDVGVGRGVTRGAMGAQFPERGVTIGAPNDCRGSEKSQQCHKYLFQCSTFTSGRPEVRK